jgi:hypothetical protein
VKYEYGSAACLLSQSGYNASIATLRSKEIKQ